MKKFIAIIVATSMLATSAPMNVFASSYNSISKRVTVKDNDPIGSDYTNSNETDVATTGSSYKPVYLKLVPETGIDRGSSIIISIENGKFDKSVYKMPEYVSGAGNSYDEMIDELSTKTLTEVLKENLGENTLELPYKIVNVSKREIEVQLFPISERDCDKTNNTIAYDKVYYYIPIHALADGTGDVKITIDDNDSNISGGSTYTIATASDDDGSTTATIDDLTTFRDSAYMETITIKENIKDTFESGKTITARLSSGFNIIESDKTTVTLIGSSNTVSLPITYADNDKITFTLPTDLSDFKGATARIKIENLYIEAEDEDDDWGDVNLTVSGAGITKETITIATRSDYGFKMTVKDSIPTILSGRTYINSKLDDNDFETATFKFEETNSGSWLTNRKIKFTLPEGVKIVDYDIDNVKYVSSSALNGGTRITGDGSTLEIFNKEMSITDNECAEFEITFYVSIDADFTGDITVSVSGAGIEDGESLDDILIAQAVTPIKIESATTKTNLGYQATSTADITITETETGAFIENNKVIVAIDSLYGSNEIGFADNDIDYSINGEVEIKNFNVKDGEIYFTIDKDSYNEPSSITLKNIQIGSTRSVPYGAYDLKVYGDAIVNNYDDDVEDIYPTEGYTSSDNEDKEDLAYFDTTEGYKFADYFVVTTETGTLDNVVEVTIGSTKAIVNGEEKDMGVAPYIQAASNSTLVPLRFIAIAIGIDSDNIESIDESSKIMWDTNTKTATILYAAGNGQKIIQFTSGSNIMTVDGTAIAMENSVSTEISNDRLYVPFRALGQALGVTVNWNAETRTATYN
jgi:hypothetical protein